MGSKQDNEALERKLRPIYDALDARNWKAGLKLADAALKKYKHNQLIRSLKAYALSKSGKGAEALQICQELVKEGPEDELVLNTMTYTYKAVGRVEDITAAYLAASERSPSNTELLNGLFAAYVRESNFVKQQQTATRLVKAAGVSPKQKPPQEQQVPWPGPGQGSQGAAKYTWWAVCSLVLQARAALLGAPASLPADKLLQLAESMASRQAKDSAGVPSSYEELLLLLDILHGQGKHTQALQLLDKAGSDVLPLEADRQHLKAAALARSGDLAAAGDAYRSLALANPDDWASWVLYLDCLLPASSAGTAGAFSGGPPLRFPVGVVGGLADLWDAGHPWRQQERAPQDRAGTAKEEAWQEVETTLARLQETVQAQPKLQQQAERGSLRGPALAPLELALRRLRLAEASGQPKGDGTDAAERAVGEEVLRTYRATAGNFSCAADLRPGLRALTSPDLRRWLAAEVHRAAASAGAARPAGSSSGDAPAAESSEAGSSSEVAAAAAAAAAAAPESTDAGRNGDEGRVSGRASAGAEETLACSPAEGGGVALAAAEPAAVNGTADVTAAGGPSSGGAAAAAVPGGDALNGARAGPADAAQLRRFQTRVSAYQVEFELGLPAYTSSADAEAHAQEVLALYRDNLHLSASLDEKDRGYGEELACIAAAALLRAGQMELSAGPRQACKRLLQALLVVEAAQVRRRVSAPLRLAACALYGLAGAPMEAAANLAALDIKFILHDTLTGHWLLPLLLGAGAEPADLKRWLTGIGFLHEDHEREAGETLMLAYYAGTYSKVVEFVDFKQRLASSHTWALGRTEEAALKLRSAAAAGAVATPLLLAALEGVGYLQEGALPQAQGQGRFACSAAADMAGSAQAEAPCPVAGLLRFNEDLSTRPAWLPPAAGPCRLAVAEWWEAWAGGGCHGGYAQCWWAEVGAADGSQGAEVTSWRRLQAANLAQRRLLPGLLSAALSSRPTPAEHAALGARLKELVAVLGQGGGQAPVEGAAAAAAATGDGEGPWEDMLEACLTQRAQQADHDVSSSTAAVQAVHLALFAAAHALHAALLAPSGSAQAAGLMATAVARLAQLQSLLAALCQRVAASLAAPEDPEKGPLLGALPPSEGVCLASAVLMEEAVWLAGCLQAWSKLVKPAGGKGKPAGEQQGPPGELRSALRSLSTAAAQAVTRIQEALGALLAPTQQQQVRQLAADLDLFGSGANGADSTGPPGPAAAALRMLWAFEPDFKPLDVLQKLVSSQREVLVRLQGQAKAVLGMLAAAQL